jgi:hypothetical protein
MTTPMARELTISTTSHSLTHYSGGLATKLRDVIAKAQEEAAAHRPPSDAARMDKNEIEIQSEAEATMANEHQLFSHVLTESSRAAHELKQKIAGLEPRIQQLLSDDSLRSAAEIELAEERASLTTATETRMRAEVDLRAFRALHGISEQATYPESHVWHMAVILALAFAETVINAFFYENAQGLLGGFAVAAAVAAINMLGALVLGMLFRYKNLADALRKTAGWLCFAAFVLLTIYCNALFAAFRSNYQTVSDPSDPVQLRDAFRAAAEQAGRVFVFDMQFGDLMSFILFGTGLLLSCFAFYKGYTFDDPYPGHGVRDRRVKAARREEQTKQEIVRQKLKDFLQLRRREVQAVTREPLEFMTSAGQSAAALQHANTICEAQQDAIQRDFDLLLRSYRDANAAIRATEPPAYFRYIPDLRTPKDPAVVMGVLGILSSANEQAKAVRDRYQDALSMKLNALQRDAASILDKTFAEFLRSVERSAEEAINRMTVTVQRAGVEVRQVDA